MGSTKVKNEARDFSKEYRKNLETQLEYADKVFASEAKYQPMYAGLQASIMEEMGPRLMELYENQINPAMSRMDLEATRSKRLADVEALEQFGGRATAAIEAADPQTAALRRELNSQALSELELGGSLTAAQKRNLRQSVAQGQSQRGFGRGVSDQAMSSLAELDLMEQRRRSRQQFAQSQMGMSAALGADPAMAILGRQSRAFNPMAIGAQAQGLGPGNVFNPESAYAGQLHGQNSSQAFAASKARAQAKSSMIGGIVGGLGKLGGAAIGAGGWGGLFGGGTDRDE
jgi:hypothetical protein